MKLNQFVDDVFDSVTGYVRRTLESSVKPLATRLAALEARPQMQYLGVWRDGQEHAPGSFLTHDGSLWHCNAPTSTKPGTSGDWTLAVKRGRDAPEAKAYTVK